MVESLYLLFNHSPLEKSSIESAKLLAENCKPRARKPRDFSPARAIGDRARKERIERYEISSMAKNGEDTVWGKLLRAIDFGSRSIAPYSRGDSIDFRGVDNQAISARSVARVNRRERGIG